MPKPTQQQLEKINKFSMSEMTEKNCVVFNDMMIDNQMTAYSSIVHKNLLNTFAKNAKRGTPLMTGHDTSKLPVGRSYDANIIVEYDDNGNEMYSLYGEFYIDLGRNTESGMSTDDLAKGIEAGTIFDTSIGFNANSWTCSICGNDIRDYTKCSHYPGRKYAVEREGEDVIETCYVVAGMDGLGELLENSLVFAGACDRATIKNQFSAQNTVKESGKGTKLHLVDNFKNIPLDAKIYQYYTKDGSVLFTDSPDRTEGDEILKKRSDEGVELAKIKEVLGEFGIEVETPDELSAKLKEINKAEELTAKETELNELNVKVEELEGKLSAKDEEFNAKVEELSAKETEIEGLKVERDELLVKSELAETYRNDLTEKALGLGVRAQGNAFNKDMYSRFLGTLSVDEIKEVILGFEKEVDNKFEGARTSNPKAGKTEKEMTVEDFETEVEFRDFVADKASAYAKENGVSIGEATRLMMKKYSKDGSDE